MSMSEKDLLSELSAKEREQYQRDLDVDQICGLTQQGSRVPMLREVAAARARVRRAEERLKAICNSVGRDYVTDRADDDIALCARLLDAAVPAGSFTIDEKAAVVIAERDRLKAVLLSKHGGEPLALLEELDAAREQNNILRMEKIEREERISFLEQARDNAIAMRDDAHRRRKEASQSAGRRISLLVDLVQKMLMVMPEAWHKTVGERVAEILSKESGT